MKALSTIEALAQAIEMLRRVQHGHQFTAAAWHGNLQAFEEARDAHRRQQLVDQARRDNIRSLAGRRKTLPAKVETDYGTDPEAA